MFIVKVEKKDEKFEITFKVKATALNVRDQFNALEGYTAKATIVKELD